MEKDALFGAVARGASWLGKLPMRGIRRMGGEGAGLVQRAAANDPFGTAMAIGSAPLAVPMFAPSPESAAAKTQLSQGVSQLGAPMKTALASAGITLHALEESVKIAAPNRVQQLMGMVQEPAREAASRSGGWGPAKLLGAATALTAAQTAFGLGAQGANHIAGKLGERSHEASRHKRWAATLKADPTLAEEPHAEAYFAVLDRASPYIAGEPYVAAPVIRQLLSRSSGREDGLPNLTAKDITDLLSAESKRQETRFPMQNRPAKVDIREIEKFNPQE